MRCKELINDLSGYLDGNLEPELAQHIQQHLEHCDDCRIVVDSTRKTIQICCSTDPLPLPQDVKDRLNRLYRDKLGVNIPETGIE